MICRFLHTADWQIGKPFSSVQDPAKRHRLQEERIQAIRRMASLAVEKQADFVLMAGDLFDSPHVTKSTVSAACAAIGTIGVPVLAIPGNHDHGGPGSVWEQDFFQREQRQLAPNLQVLLKAEPVILEQAVIFPAPLLRRHEPGNPAAWIREAALDPALPVDRPRIALAHGTIQGFGLSQAGDEGGATAANWIDLSTLPMEALDYIALGDWHGTKQVGPKAWYSGTPEIDRFPKGEGNDPGHVLAVTVDRNTTPLVEKIATGRLAWHDMTFRFDGDESLADFTTRLSSQNDSGASGMLLSLELEGSLGIDASARLEELLEAWEARLLHLRLQRNLTIAPSPGEIAALQHRADDPLIATVAGRLIERMQAEGEEAILARLALRELYRALN